MLGVEWKMEDDVYAWHRRDASHIEIGPEATWNSDMCETWLGYRENM